MKERFIDQNRKDFPHHVAIIMDGNRRWSTIGRVSIEAGYQKGADRVEEIVIAAKQVGVSILTLYLFSTENWKRSNEEIYSFFSLFASLLSEKFSFLREEGICFSTIGDRSSLPEFLQKLLQRAERESQERRSRDHFQLVLALNYGSRNEIIRSIQTIVEDCQKGKLQREEITEETLSSYLDTARWQNPDLLIRTSGEMRLSNFLLWQLSYTELFFTETLWPDFGKAEFLQILYQYGKREKVGWGKK